MIVLDTNVISEMLKSTPDPQVSDWLGRQSRSNLRATSISMAEMLAGASFLPAGRRRDLLEAMIRELYSSQFEPELLPFDASAANRYAEIVAQRRRVGRPVGQMDAQIAAIALSKAATVATRDIADFEAVGLDLINPWDA